MKKFLLSAATMFALLWAAGVTTPASAQIVPACPVAEPNLTFTEWHAHCARTIEATCSLPAFQIFQGCRQSVGQAMYANYVGSQGFLHGGSCNQFNVGLRMCINGWVATCNGTMWVTSSLTCAG